MSTTVLNTKDWQSILLNRRSYITYIEESLKALVKKHGAENANTGPLIELRAIADFENVVIVSSCLEDSERNSYVLKKGGKLCYIPKSVVIEHRNIKDGWDLFVIDYFYFQRKLEPVMSLFEVVARDSFLKPKDYAREES